MRELKIINIKGFKEGEWVRGFDLSAKPEQKTRPRKMERQEITKEQFLTNLDKVCQPINKKSTDSNEK
ncbi:MAG: hypothetical protein PHY28_08830 [Dehalococcoidales bacterium]|nr:hypothetical protein [Dehalococcoidales bacterium]